MLGDGEYFDSRIGQTYLRARLYDAQNARFNRLDPFRGNFSDPLSFNKYGFVHGDPMQGIDPSGNQYSLGGALATIGIGAAIGISAHNASNGWANGQADFATSARIFAKDVVLSPGGYFAFKFFLSQTMLLKLTEAVGVGVLWTKAGNNPGKTIGWAITQSFIDAQEILRRNKQTISSAASEQQIPAELLAAVLLAEIDDYDLYDFIGDDDLSYNPEERSVGWAQLQIDDVRTWGLSLPEWGPLASLTPAWRIRNSLMDETDAIRLLAQAVRHFSRQGRITNPGVPVDLSSWSTMVEAQKEMLAWEFGQAKDSLQGYLADPEGSLGHNALVAYQKVRNWKVLQ
jgi:RHS repeat-associated protein